MGYKDTRILVATRSMEFFNGIKGGLLDASFTELIININSIRDSETKFDRLRPCVLILDLDECTATVQYAKQLLEKYRVFILLTASSPAMAMTYIQAGIKEFVVRPRMFNDFYCNMFINAISVKIKLFLDSTPTMTFIQTQRTVDVNQKIIAIASSTGGTEALDKILRSLPADIPPILIVQHMPSGFTKLFAARLNNICFMEVKEAANNEYLNKGTVYIAPADHHMRLVRRNSKLMLECFKGTKIHGVMPAADILFESIANIMRANAIGVILTGMGADGAKGLYLMHLQGAKTIGQDEASCVVYGMPKVAYDLGALDMQVPLDKVAGTLMSLIKK